MEFTEIFLRYLAISIIVVSIYYINIFFDAASRQTSSDIIRTNQIVNRIRTDNNYSTEPLKFKIVGTKSFPVIGWSFHQQQALNTNWSKYRIFKNFTDFKYTRMTNKEYKEITDYLIQKGETIHGYPAKNSILIYKNKAVLFLNPNELNSKIYFSKLPKRTPDIISIFNIYIENNNVYYYKSPCSEQDIKHRVFLHVYPLDNNHLPKNSKQNGFQNMDFSFTEFSKIDNRCIGVKQLPTYDVLKMVTGQYTHSKRIWEAIYFFDNKHSKN